MCIFDYNMRTYTKKTKTIAHIRKTQAKEEKKIHHSINEYKQNRSNNN